MTLDESLKRRNNQGCWTCRLRRKKCDEQRPSCESCLSLLIPCHGYGHRPDWMDKGRKERCKAQEIKLLIKRGRARRASVRSQDQDVDVPEGKSNRVDHVRAQNQGNQQPSISNGHYFASITPPRSPVELANANDAQPPLLLSTGSERTHYTFDMEYNDTFAVSTITSRNGSTTEDQISALTTSDLSSWGAITDMDLLDECANLWPEESLVVFPNEHILTGVALQLGGTCPVASPPKHTVLDHPTMNYYQNYIIPTFFPFMNSEATQLLSTHISTKQMTKTDIGRSLHGCIKLFQQMDEVKFGFCTSKKHEVDARKWLETACQKLNSTLMQADDHIWSLSCDNVPHHTVTEVPGHYDLSEVLLLMVHVIMVQTYCKGIDYILLQDLLKDILVHCLPTLPALDVLCQRILNFLLAFRTLWSATHEIQSLPSDLAYLHLTTLTSMEETTGCRPWIFEGIDQVTRLRQWKRSQMELQSLNVAELVRKSNDIEALLSKESDLVRQSSLQLDKGTCTSNPRDDDINHITNVYYGALQIFLHTVISGPMPEVSHIKRFVQETIDAVRALPHTKLIHRLAWPLCVTASLADSSHDLFFDRLRQGVKATQSDNINVLRAFDIAAECRRLRSQTSRVTDAFDWYDAIESLGLECIVY